MNARIPALVLFATASAIIAACATTASLPSPQAPEASEATAPSVEPSAAPSESAAAEREVAGTITVAEGMAFSGPGGTVQEALDIGPTGEFPTLVNGVLFRDTDGTIYLATAVSDATAPTFDGPMLEVLNMDNEGDSWDIANAALLGLEEANGIVFNRNAQVLGYLEID